MTANATGLRLPDANEGVRLGTGTLAAVGTPHERISEAKPQERAAQLA